MKPLVADDTHSRDERVHALHALYLRAWLVGSLGAAFGHIVTPRREAAKSQWPASPGWQHEIGIFNLVVAILLAQVLRTGSIDSRRMMTRTGLFFGLTAGSAHAHALLTARDDNTSLHRGALLLNAVSVASAAMVLLVDRAAV